MGHAGGNVTLIQNEAEAEAYLPPTAKPLALVSQTTLAVSEVQHVIDVLQRRFPGIHLPAKSDICYATENRQVAVRAMAPGLRRDPRDRLEQQLQLAQPARRGRRGRTPGLPDRRSGDDPAGMARRA